jgi:hypothetical protein
MEVLGKIEGPSRPLWENSGPIPNELLRNRPADWSGLPHLGRGSEIEKDLLDPCLLIVKEIIDVPSTFFLIAGMTQ